MQLRLAGVHNWNRVCPSCSSVPLSGGADSLWLHPTADLGLIRRPAGIKTLFAKWRISCRGGR